MRNLLPFAAGSAIGLLALALVRARARRRAREEYSIVPLESLTARQLEEATALLRTQWPNKLVPSYLADTTSAQWFLRSKTTVVLLALTLRGARVVGHVRVAKTSAGGGVPAPVTAALARGFSEKTRARIAKRLLRRSSAKPDDKKRDDLLRMVAAGVPHQGVLQRARLRHGLSPTEARALLGRCLPSEREAEAREKRPSGEKKNNQHLFAALEQLVVAPAHRGRGVGGALCRAAAVAASEVLKVGGLVGYTSRYDASLPAWYKQLDNAAVTSAEAAANQPVQMTAKLTGEAVQRAKEALSSENDLLLFSLTPKLADR